MVTFNQQGQRVNNQYIAARDINFAAGQNQADLIGELEKLKAEIGLAREQGVLSEAIATDAESQIAKAILQAKQEKPHKQTILDHLNGAKTLLEGVGTATGLVTGLVEAAQAIQKFFT